MRLKSIITVIALILIMFMSAIESSIISLALPTIKQDLNAGNLISLIFTAYFIALVIANPIVGELLSRFKIIYVAIAGLLLFSIGSFMCGLSTNFYYANYITRDTRFWIRCIDVIIANCSKVSI
ncbi:major facilitator superfamily transporter [Staphylococcus aureus]|nr:major facilitator superfamily transporter [Staphylococcus aureus]